MGESKATIWVLGLILYFFILFLFTSSLQTSRELLSFSDNRLNVTDPGWREQGNVFFNPTYQNQCSGTGGGRSMNFLQNIQCNQLALDNEDYNGCNNVTGCTWQNRSSFFGLFVSDPECTGIVDKTTYNITGGLNTYCESSGLQSVENCTLFKCDWVDFSSLPTNTKGASLSGNEPLSLSTTTNIWNTIKFMASFRTDIGLGNFNFIFSLLFFWIPTVMLLLAIYFMIPFFH